MLISIEGVHRTQCNREVLGKHLTLSVSALLREQEASAALLTGASSSPSSLNHPMRQTSLYFQKSNFGFPSPLGKIGRQADGQADTHTCEHFQGREEFENDFAPGAAFVMTLRREFVFYHDTAGQLGWIICKEGDKHSFEK